MLHLVFGGDCAIGTPPLQLPRCLTVGYVAPPHLHERVIWFGKHKGLNYKELLDTQPSYCRWFVNKVEQDGNGLDDMSELASLLGSYMLAVLSKSGVTPNGKQELQGKRTKSDATPCDTQKVPRSSKYDATDMRGIKLKLLGGPFKRQQLAVSYLNELISNGEEESRLGLFAEDYWGNGAKRYYVDLFDRFATAFAIKFPKGQSADAHFYEIIRPDQPCWLYFDLEYIVELNPHLDPAEAMAAFWSTLAAFATDSLGMQVDSSSIFELESSTPEKFSMHVVVKSWILHGSDGPEEWAFASNALAGKLVSGLVSYAREHRNESLCDHIFVQGSKGEVPLIDTSVYSPNRCFRLLHNTKMGKDAVLKLKSYPLAGESDIAGGIGGDSVQMLSTMVSRVPKTTQRFSKDLVPERFLNASSSPTYRGHAALRDVSGEASFASLATCLARHWEDTHNRRQTPVFDRRRGCSSAWQSETTMLVVNLNNGFCLNRNGLHKSNCRVFLVVDLQVRKFQQRCHDGDDCPCFRSAWFNFPDDAPTRTALLH